MFLNYGKKFALLVCKANFFIAYNIL